MNKESVWEYKMIVNEYRSVSFDGACDMGKEMFVSCQIFNGMLKLNKETHKAEYVCKFPGERSNATALHHKIYKYNDCLVFAPDNAKGIHIYDMCRDEISYYAIHAKCTKRNRCIGSVLIGEKLWLFYAYAEHPVIIFDLSTFKMESFGGIADMVPEEIVERNTPAFLSMFGCYGTKVYGVIWNSPYIVEIETVQRTVEVYKIREECRLSAIAYDGKDFWLTEYGNGPVIQWNKQYGIVAEYYLETGSNGIYWNVACVDKYVILLSKSDNYVFGVNKEALVVEPFCELPEGFEGFDDVRKGWRRNVSYDVWDGVLRVYPGNANMMLDIDVYKRSIKGYKFLLEDKYNDEWYNENIFYPDMVETSPKRIFKEKSTLTLEDYIGYILNEH